MAPLRAPGTNRESEHGTDVTLALPTVLLRGIVRGWLWFLRVTPRIGGHCGSRVPMCL